MTAQRNKIHHLTTITRLAIELGQDEEWLAEIAEQMEPKDGLIWVYGLAEDGVMAFSDHGIDCLQKIIAEHKENSGE